MSFLTRPEMIITASQLAAELVARGIRKDDRMEIPFDSENPPFWSARRNVPIDPKISVINVVREGGLLNWVVRYDDATGEINYVGISDGCGHSLCVLNHFPGFEELEDISEIVANTWGPHCRAQGDWEDEQEAGE